MTQERKQAGGCAPVVGAVLVPILALTAYTGMFDELREAGAPLTMVRIVRVALAVSLPAAVVGGVVRGRFPLNRERVRSPVSGLTFGLLGAIGASIWAPTAKAGIYAVVCVTFAFLWVLGMTAFLSRAIHKFGGWGYADWDAVRARRERAE